MKFFFLSHFSFGPATDLFKAARILFTKTTAIGTTSNLIVNIIFFPLLFLVVINNIPPLTHFVNVKSIRIGVSEVCEKKVITTTNIIATV